eukprot:COSAG01_NODE_12034_length_1811_cov_1.429322_1_plen_122_part_00
MAAICIAWRNQMMAALGGKDSPMMAYVHCIPILHELALCQEARAVQLYRFSILQQQHHPVRTTVMPWPRTLRVGCAVPRRRIHVQTADRAAWFAGDADRACRSYLWWRQERLRSHTQRGAL